MWKWRITTKGMKNWTIQVIQRANQWFTAAQKLKTQHSTYYINQDAKRWWLTRVLNDWDPSSLITATTLSGSHSKFSKSKMASIGFVLSYVSIDLHTG